MEEVIGQKKPIINSNPNIKSNINNFNKSSKSPIKNIFNRLIFQTVVCIIIVVSLIIYKNTQIDSYNYNMNKYKWIINYTLTYNDIYNNISNYINNKFGFNIPLKENIELNTKENNNEVLAKQDDIVDILNEKNGEVIEVANSYDSMKVMANDITQKYEFVLPTTGSISSAFGNRNPSSSRISSFHLGIDIANDLGTDIVSASTGNVLEASYNDTYGNYIKIGKDDLVLIYAHCSKTLVSNGQEIKKGQKIALMGNTGISTGPHLHFEVRKNGYVINPEYIINFR